jgi:hypothetical protein
MNEQAFSHPPEVTLSKLRQEFDEQLENIKAMLRHKSLQMPDAAWVKFVDLTRQSIIDHPDQYVDCTLPTPEVLAQVINALFDDFLEKMLTR